MSDGKSETVNGSSATVVGGNGVTDVKQKSSKTDIKVAKPSVDDTNPSSTPEAGDNGVIDPEQKSSVKNGVDTVSGGEAADSSVDNTKPLSAPEASGNGVTNTEQKSAEKEGVETVPGGKTADSSADASPELVQKIIRQVEYYFGDFSLPKDRFLQEEIKKNDGWIPLSVMLNFKRLKALSDNIEVIGKALRSSTTGLVEINSDCDSIRRLPSKPLPVLNEERRNELTSRTLYMKGFPLDCDLDTLLKFFPTVGDFENVQMRNWHDKVEDKWKFKGSVFVTFFTKEKAQEILDKGPVKYGETELIMKWQAEYIEAKRTERSENKRSKDKKKTESKVSSDAEKVEDVPSEVTPNHKLGTVMHLKGIKDGVKWQNIKDVLTEMKCGDVAFVDFSEGDVEAYVRFMEEDVAKKVFEKFEEPGVMKINGDSIEARVLAGEEELKYLQDQAEARAKRSTFKRRGSRHRGGGRGGGRAKRFKR